MKGLDFVGDGDGGIVTDERYIRLYTRDTADWLLLPWEARAVFPLVGRKLDRAGILELGAHEPAKAVAAVVGMPLDTVRVELDALLAAGFLELRAQQLLDPVFIESQEAKSSDAARARDYRLRRRAKTTVTKRDAPEQVPPGDHGDATGATREGPLVDVPTVTKRDSVVTKRDAPVTPRVGTVTPSCTEPSCTEPSEESTSSSVEAEPGQLELVTTDSPPAGAGAPKSNGSRKRSKNPTRDAHVIRVFRFWCEDTGHTNAKLDLKRAKRIRQRLDDGFTCDELEAAIRNRRNDPWLMGQDPKSTRVYDDVETLLRDVAQVERLRDLTTRRSSLDRRIERLREAQGAPS